MDEFVPEAMTIAEMRKAVREARKQSTRPASKLGKDALIDELRSYRAKAQVKTSEPEPKPKPKKKAADPEIVTGRLSPDASSNPPTTQEKRLAALAKAREARKRNLEAKGTPMKEATSSKTPSVKGVEKKRAQSNQ